MWLTEKVVIDYPQKIKKNEICQLLKIDRSKEYLFGCMSVHENEKQIPESSNPSSNSSSDFSILEVVDGGSLGSNLALMTWGSSFQLQDRRHPNLTLIPAMGHSSGIKLNPLLLPKSSTGSELDYEENTVTQLAGGSWIGYNYQTEMIEKQYQIEDGLVYFMVISRPVAEENKAKGRLSGRPKKKSRRKRGGGRMICSGGVCRLVKKPKILAGNKRYKK